MAPRDALVVAAPSDRERVQSMVRAKKLTYMVGRVGPVRRDDHDGLPRVLLARSMAPRPFHACPPAPGMLPSGPV